MGGEDSNGIYSWLDSQSLPVKMILGPPIWFFGALFSIVLLVGVFIYLIPCCYIPAFFQEQIFRRKMRRENRVVEWRHVQSRLIADPESSLLVEVTPQGYRDVWCCPHQYCKDLPLYEEYLEKRRSVFYEEDYDQRIKHSKKIAIQCLRDCQVFFADHWELQDLLDEHQLPKDRIHVIFGLVYNLAKLKKDEKGRWR